ncbi:MAG: methyltransferase domain-containing protein [Thermoanaerobaculia bacterium]|nr:methyltransferase domain-containing protein [Thermoanaerobaculia bacterium]
MGWFERLLARRKRYRARDFAARERFRDDYRAIARHLLEALEFGSAYDVGCANGFLVEELARAGREAAGIELSPAVKELLPAELAARVAIGDFAEASGRWDLVCCVEVAEHLPPERSEELVATLAGLARRWIYFSAAPPGQGGRGHINCRPHAEWLGWFGEQGWREDVERTARLRAFLATRPSVPWLRVNSLLLAPAGTPPDEAP